jgi:hypothetical protein
VEEILKIGMGEFVNEQKKFAGNELVMRVGLERCIYELLQFSTISLGKNSSLLFLKKASHRPSFGDVTELDLA